MRVKQLTSPRAIDVRYTSVLLSVFRRTVRRRLPSPPPPPLLLLLLPPMN